MLSESICQAVLARALRGGGAFAEIFFEDTRVFDMTLRSGKIERAAVSRPRGAGAAARRRVRLRRRGGRMGDCAAVRTASLP